MASGAGVQMIVGERRATAAVQAVLVGLVALVVPRLFLGVDLGDESYYLAFADEWLKRGLGGADSLAVHQSAAFLVYSAAAVFRWITGGVDGLMLLYRFVFLATWIVATLSLFAFVRRVLPRLAAFGAAATFFLFLPFGLPAPSYNTLFVAFTTIAVSQLGLAAASRRSEAASGVAFALAAVAYPPFLPVAAGFAVVAGGLWLARRNCMGRVFALCFAATLVGTVLAMVGLLGRGKLGHVFEFTLAIADPQHNVLFKASQAWTILRSAPGFVAALALAFASGLVLVLARDVRVRLAALAASAAAMMYLAVGGTVLFAGGHDLVLFLVVLGSALAVANGWLWRSSARISGFGRTAGSPPRSALPAALLLPFAACVLAGAVMGVASNNGLVNFPVGAAAAAALAVGAVVALALGSDHARLRAAGLAWLVIVAASTTYHSLSTVYGEDAQRWPAKWELVRDGVFAGLFTSPAQHRYLGEVSAALARAKKSGPDGRRSVAVFGRMCGLYLLGDLSPRALTTWELFDGQGQAARDMVRAYWESNPPDVILRYADPWTAPLQMFQQDLLSSSYEKSEELDVEYRHVEVWLRRPARRSASAQ